MIIEADNILPSYRYAPSSIDTFMWLLVRNNVLEFFKIFKNSYIWLQIILGNQMSYIYIYIHYLIKGFFVWISSFCVLKYSHINS